MMPVLSIQCKFIKSAFYDDELTIITTIKQLPKVRIHFHYEIYNSDNEIITKAEVELVTIDMETKKLITTPAVLVDALAPFFK
jgi:acyl-CoA thioester hydrolase